MHNARGLVLYGRCDERLPVPYQLFADALRPAVEPLGLTSCGLISAISPASSAASSPSCPRSGAVPDGPSIRAAGPVDGSSALVEAVSRERRTLLVLDDLHWAPQPTLTLLRHVMLAPRPLDLLFLLAHRDTGLGADHVLAQFTADVAGVTTRSGSRSAGSTRKMSRRSWAMCRD